MALSAVEEAQTRLLLDKIAALQSLAESEPTIISKLGAQKVNLSQLPVATAAASDDLLIVRQGTQDKAITFGAVKSGIADGAVLAVNNLSEIVNKQTAFNTIKQPATETVTGVVELATDAEAQAGTDATRATHPRGVLASIGAFFTGKKASQAEVDARANDVNYMTPAKASSGLTILDGTGLSNTTGTTAPGWQGYVRLPKFIGALQFSYGYTRMVVGGTVGNSQTSNSFVWLQPFTQLFAAGATTITNGADPSEAVECKANLAGVSNTNVIINAMRVFGNNTTNASVGVSFWAFGRWA